MDVLIVGGAGFIGSNLCERLLNDGNRVWCVDNFSTGERANVELFAGNPNFNFAECGVETEAFLNFCENSGVRFDQVYDLACPTGVPNIETLGEEMLEACSDGTRNALAVAKKHGARLLYTSSSEIYGAPEVSPQTEKYNGNVDPRGPRANYEEGKRFSETWVMLYVRKYGLNARIVRLFNVYGPRMSSADFRVIPRFMTQALAAKPLTVHGKGSQTRTLCYIDDIVDGLILAMEKGPSGEVYNLGSDIPVTILSLAEQTIAAIGSESEITFTPRASHDHESRLPSLEKIKALGWEPKVDLTQGLVRTADDFRNRGAQAEMSAFASSGARH